MVVLEEQERAFGVSCLSDRDRWSMQRYCDENMSHVTRCISMSGQVLMQQHGRRGIGDGLITTGWAVLVALEILGLVVRYAQCDGLVSLDMLSLTQSHAFIAVCAP